MGRVVGEEYVLYVKNMGRICVLEEVKCVKKDGMGRVDGEMYVLYVESMCCLFKIRGCLLNVCAVCEKYVLFVLKVCAVC